MFLVPVNDPRKINDRLTVRLFPADDTLDAATFSMHWLLAIVPPLPSVAEPAFPVPESFVNTIVLLAGV